MTKGSRKQPKARRKAQTRTAKKRGVSAKAETSIAVRSLKWLFVLFIWGAIAAVGVVGWAAYELPDIDVALKSQRPPSVTVLAANGHELTTRGGRFGRPVHIQDIPKPLIWAVLATEDRRFYDHPGVDFIGIGRAFMTNLMHGGIRQGGSTITQQVAKNLFLSAERSYKRKLQEVLIALWLEARFSKDQIFALYLNRVYFGGGAYGISAASNLYFGRPVEALGLYDSAMLAGLLKAPSRYNPRASMQEADKRTAQVLSNMVAAGYITSAQAKSAKNDRLAVSKPTGGVSELGYFIDYVLDRVRDLAPGSGDMIVTTTLDLKLQRLAETHMKKVMAEAKQSGASQSALVSINPDGAIRAMVGGFNYRTSAFNRATQAKRQPGSAFKAFVYLAGLEAGLKPSDTLDDAPISIEGWEPRNYAGSRFLGPVTLKTAFAKSLNTVAVRVSETAGRHRVADVAMRLGIPGDIAEHPSIALGVTAVSLLDLTAAYAPFANGGLGVWAYAIDEILSPDGRVIYRRKGSGPGRVVTAQDVGMMNMMFTEVLATGTGRSARIDYPAGGKTGTSQNHRDAVFVGFTADLVTGVWFGNDDGRPMKKVTGGGLPARLWQGFMRDAHAGLKPRSLPGMTSTTPVIVQREQQPPIADQDDAFFDNILELMRDDRG